ncbi:MAG: hypothetical protein Q9205_004468, partial [Flavoplaca limonia]
MLDQEGLWKSIAVPSRLYAKESQQHPLAGARISIKDNFKLAGIKTTITNRAFTQLYPAESETAEYVKTLLRLGAVIVGKSKMCSFAAGENPGDWIDFQCPFNPRGDHDHDTVGFLSRRLDLLHNLVRGTTYLEESKTLPVQILYPKEFFPVANEEQQILLENYICVLESHLKTPRTDFSLVERWAKCPPQAAGGKSLQDYLDNSTYHHYYDDAYQESDGFREDYRHAFEREPYVGPFVRLRWDKGATLTVEERNQAKAQLGVFRRWFHENVLKPDPFSLSHAVLVLPEGKADPEYRDDAV